MTTKNCSAGCLVGLLPLAALAAGSPQQTNTYVPTPEIAAMMAKVEAAVKAGKPLPEEQRTLAAWGPFQRHMIYRLEPQPLVYTNDDFAEYYVILEGHGTMTIGGKLVDPKRTGPHAEAKTVQGSTPNKVAKGDLLMVPPGVPHGVTHVDGKLVYMSMHIPLEPKVQAAAAR
jgi:mannose-6-phosphate isomerase-like protein (cupin superfamily)